MRSAPKPFHVKMSKSNHVSPNTVCAASTDSGWTIESAAHYTRGRAPAAPDHDSPEPARRDRVATEQQRLLQWAKTNGKLGGGLPREDASGGEHSVHYDHQSRRYWKTTRLECQKGYGLALGSLSRGATPAEYLDRLLLQNRFFADDIRLERVVLKADHPVIVTSQPAVAGTAAPPDLVDALMEAERFERLASGTYYRDGFLVFDLVPRNAILAADGVVYPIDPVIQRIDPSLAGFLRENPWIFGQV